MCYIAFIAFYHVNCVLIAILISSTTHRHTIWFIGLQFFINDQSCDYHCRSKR